jgi:hypothetical protein
MTAKNKIDLAPTVRIAPGYVVVNVSTAAGGVSYNRIVLAENPEGEAIVTDYQTRKTVDHVELVKAIDHTVKDVDHALRILCVRTPFGHFVSMDKVETVRLKVAEIAARVHELNDAAEAAGSAHRGRVGVVTALLDIANPDNLRECHRVIRETLMEIHAALRRGDVRDEKNEDGDITRRHQLRPILIRARNLEQMALGLHGTTIKSALERAKTAKTEILAQIDAGVTPEDAGAAVALGEIETAIAWFEDED